MIQSVDSFKLLRVINNAAVKINRTIDCLLQFHIAEEETKYGFSMNEVRELADSDEVSRMGAVRICGVMGMATFTDNMDQVRNEFRYLTGCYRELKEEFFSDQDHFREISMGMSGDYTVAIEEGSTIIRIGSIIFGGQ
ncbi:MAG: YggS family pyridoxal phosphate-dependent enzyme, partial [Bacteroidales bacterium]|nr:YggS family pyridoxal phosphate-dependent enzyme [Bacteroidales bacterium]